MPPPLASFSHLRGFGALVVGPLIVVAFSSSSFPERSNEGPRIGASECSAEADGPPECRGMLSRPPSLLQVRLQTKAGTQQQEGVVGVGVEEGLAHEAEADAQETRARKANQAREVTPHTEKKDRGQEGEKGQPSRFEHADLAEVAHHEVPLQHKEAQGASRGPSQLQQDQEKQKMQQMQPSQPAAQVSEPLASQSMNRSIARHQNIDAPSLVSVKSKRTITRSGPLKSRNGVCVDAPSATTVGSSLHMWTCYAGLANQQWEYDDDTQLIRLANDGLCLSYVSPYVAAKYGTVELKTCDSTTKRQKWLIDCDTGLITSRLYGYCLASDDPSTDGGRLRMWKCTEWNTTQMWDLGDSEASSDVDRQGTIQNRDGICLDAPYRNTVDSNPHMWTCISGNDNQAWQFDSTTGQIKIVDGLCLAWTADAATTSTYGTVKLSSCSLSCTNQQWTYDDSTGLISNPTNGVCLDSYARNTNGGNVHVWACNSANVNQQWTLGSAITSTPNVDGSSTCHTTVSGETCYTHVMWAINTGVTLSTKADVYPLRLWDSPSFTDMQAFLHYIEVDNGACPFPCVDTCHTTVSGETCYSNTYWAQTSGIYSSYADEWYYGLTSSSSFEAFQAILYLGMSSGCNYLPCDGITSSGSVATTTTTTAAATTKTTTTTTAATSSEVTISSECYAVWNTPAVNMYDSSEVYSCGARIEYLLGIGYTTADALIKIALEHPDDCSECWPYEKYKTSGDTSVSSKRGIAIENKLLIKASLTNLAPVVSWSYGWGYSAKVGLGGITLGVSSWDSAGISWMPMVWDGFGLISLENDISSLSWGSGSRDAILGFNEPNLAGQANMDPAAAAALWPELETLATRMGISTLVSPAVSVSGTSSGKSWLTYFMGNCTGCKIDAIAFHSYTCYGRFLKDHLDIFRSFGKPLWLTEFACAESGTLSSPRLSMSGQMAFMKEAIPLLEADADVEKYAWFSYFEDQWLYSDVAGDAGLVNSDGTLSELGKLYETFLPGGGV